MSKTLVTNKSDPYDTTHRPTVEPLGSCPQAISQQSSPPYPAGCPPPKDPTPLHLRHKVFVVRRLRRFLSCMRCSRPDRGRCLLCILEVNCTTGTSVTAVALNIEAYSGQGQRPRPVSTTCVFRSSTLRLSHPLIQFSSTTPQSEAHHHITTPNICTNGEIINHVIHPT